MNSAPVESFDIEGMAQDIYQMLAKDLADSSQNINFVDVVHLEDGVALGVKEEFNATYGVYEHEVDYPSFDMKWEKEYIQNLDLVAGNLLGGDAARTNKQGKLYNVIPIDTSYDPHPSSLDAVDKVLFPILTKKADGQNVQAAIAFAHEIGLDDAAIYKWQRDYNINKTRSKAAGSVVFRTVSEDSPPGSWMFPPRTEYVTSTYDIAQSEIKSTLLQDIDEFFRGLES